MIPRYRAWCKIDNTMIKPMTIQKMIHQRNSNASIKSLYNDFVFMQSTGLRDKNYKEIYIGDIVRGVRPNLDNETKKIETIGVVKDTRCDVVIEDEKGTYDPFENYFAIVYQSGKAEIEVIGNIYENRNLIEELKRLNNAKQRRTNNKRNNSRKYNARAPKKN